MINNFFEEYNNKSKINEIKNLMINSFGISSLIFLFFLICNLIFKFNYIIYYCFLIFYYVYNLTFSLLIYIFNNKKELYNQEKTLVKKLLKDYNIKLNKINIDILKDMCIKKTTSIEHSKLSFWTFLAIVISFFALIDNIDPNKLIYIITIVLLIFIYLIYNSVRQYISIKNDQDYEILYDILNELLLENNIKKENSILKKLIEKIIS